MKKILIVLCLCLLTGCSKQETVVTESKDDSADVVAQALIANLQLENMQAVKARVIKGMIFDENDYATDASLYLSNEDGSSDCVGVFFGDVNNIQPCLETYLKEQKAQKEFTYPQEVFKISNATLLSNDHAVIMIVCEDIESARKSAQNYLNSTQGDTTND